MPFEVRHVAAASYANSIYFLSTYPNPGRATAKYSVATDLWLSLNSIPTVRTSTYGGAAALPSYSAFAHVQAAVHEGEVSNANPGAGIQSGPSDSGVPTQHRRQRPYAH